MHRLVQSDGTTDQESVMPPMGFSNFTNHSFPGKSKNV